MNPFGRNEKDSPAAAANNGREKWSKVTQLKKMVFKIAQDEKRISF